MLGTSDRPSDHSQPRNSAYIDPTVGATSFLSAHGMSVTQVATHGWLIRNEPRVGNYSGLIGCIEQRDRTFELMEIGAGFHWTTFTTFLAAVTHLAEHAEISTDAPVST